MRLLSNFIYLIIIIFLLIFVSDAAAQKSKNQIEKEISTFRNQIKETQQILAQTSNKKKASIGQLNAINKQIESHTRLISSYSTEVKVLSGQIEEDVMVINALEHDLEELKK